MDCEGAQEAFCYVIWGAGWGPEELDFLSYLTLPSCIPQWAWKNKPESILPYKNQPTKWTWHAFIWNIASFCILSAWKAFAKLFLLWLYASRCDDCCQWNQAEFASHSLYTRGSSWIFLVCDSFEHLWYSKQYSDDRYYFFTPKICIYMSSPGTSWEFVHLGLHAPVLEAEHVHPGIMHAVWAGSTWRPLSLTHSSSII